MTCASVRSDIFKATILILFIFTASPPLGYSQADEVNTLIRELKNKDPNIRSKAAATLGQARDPRAVEPLIAAMKDKDPGVRLTAAAALGQIKDPRAVKPLIAALRDKEPNVRSKAATALGEIGPPALQPLTAALQDKDSDVRSKAATALGMVGSSAMEHLTAALRDKDPRVRSTAATALGQIKDTRAIESLTAALTDESSEVREAARTALGEIERILHERAKKENTVQGYLGFLEKFPQGKSADDVRSNIDKLMDWNPIMSMIQGPSSTNESSVLLPGLSHSYNNLQGLKWFGPLPELVSWLNIRLENIEDSYALFSMLSSYSGTPVFKVKYPKGTIFLPSGVRIEIYTHPADILEFRWGHLSGRFVEGKGWEFGPFTEADKILWQKGKGVVLILSGSENKGILYGVR